MGRLRLHPSAVGAVVAAGAGMSIGLWLMFAARFDIAASPGWQFGPYYLMLALMLAASALTGCHPLFSWMGWIRWLLPALVFVLLGFFLAESWVVSGPFEGFRDRRFYSIALRTAALSVVGIALTGLFQAVLMAVAISACRMGWRRILAFPLVSRVAPPGLFSGDDQAECPPSGGGSQCQDRS